MTEFLRTLIPLIVTLTDEQYDYGDDQSDAKNRQLVASFNSNLPATIVLRPALGIIGSDPNLWNQDGNWDYEV